MTKQGKFARRTRLRRLVPHSLLPLTLALSSLLLTTVLVSAAADSDLDPSFDGDGIVTTDVDEFDEIRDIVIQPDGKIVVTGDAGFFHLSSGDRIDGLIYDNEINAPEFDAPTTVLGGGNIAIHR